MLTLTPKELKRFHKYLTSPFFNTHKDTIRLFEVLAAAYPDFPPEKIEAQTIFYQLFPDTPYKDEVLRTLRKYLLNHLKNFITYLAWQEDTHSPNLFLLEALSNRGREEDFVKEFNKSKKKLKTIKQLDSSSFFQQYYLDKVWITHELMFRKRKQLPDMKSPSVSLDHFYLNEKLQLYASALGSSNVLATELSHFFFKEEILAIVQENLDRFPLLIQANYLAVTFLENEQTSADNFGRFRQILSEHTDAFSIQDLGNLYIYAINFANRQYLHGKKAFLSQMFELYKEMLDLDLLFDGKSFPAMNYKNLTTLGLRLGELTWTEQFLESYKDKLKEESRQDSYHYNLAHLRLYQQQYSEALKLLQTVSFLDAFYQMDAKLLQLKIYYEMGEVEMFFTLNKTFQTHISRQKNIPQARRQAYLNFARLTKSLFRIRIDEKSNLKEVVAKVETMVPLIEKEWLKIEMEKLQENH
ncbi:MAG: hypothetical protein AAF587_18205 [Bacteroidota bacterium]